MNLDRPADRDSDTGMDADTVAPVKKLRDSVTGMGSEGGADTATAGISLLTGFTYTPSPVTALPPHVHRPAYLRAGGIACYHCGMGLS